MSFADGLQNALAEADDASFHRPMSSGGPPQWSGARDPVAPNADVNASVNSDLGIAASEAAAYLALKQTAPGAQVSIARSRYQVMAQPHMRAGKLFVTMSDLGSPTTDRYTLVVPSDANILPKLIKQGSVRGLATDITTATLKAEDVEAITIDGTPILEYAGKMGAGAMTGGAGRAAMLHMLRKKKEKEEKKKKGKEPEGKKKEEEEIDDDEIVERMPPGLGGAKASGRAAMLAMLRKKKEKEEEKRKKKEKGKGKGNPYH